MPKFSLQKSGLRKFSLLAACAMALSSTVQAQNHNGKGHNDNYRAGKIEIGHPWSRAVPKGATVAAGYMTIRNAGSEPDRLIGGSTPVAGKFEVHEVTMDNGVMRMRPVAGGIEIKPGEAVELKPQSLHVMMTGVTQPIEQGKSFKGVLMFEKAGPVAVDFSVEAAGATPSTTGSQNMRDMHH